MESATTSIYPIMITVLGFLITIMLGIVSYFLKDLHEQIKTLSTWLSSLKEEMIILKTNRMADMDMRKKDKELLEHVNNNLITQVNNLAKELSDFKRYVYDKLDKLN